MSWEHSVSEGGWWQHDPQQKQYCVRFIWILTTALVELTLVNKNDPECKLSTPNAVGSSCPTHVLPWKFLLNRRTQESFIQPLIVKNVVELLIDWVCLKWSVSMRRSILMTTRHIARGISLRWMTQLSRTLAKSRPPNTTWVTSAWKATSDV